LILLDSKINPVLGDQLGRVGTPASAGGFRGNVRQGGDRLGCFGGGSGGGFGWREIGGGDAWRLRGQNHACCHQQCDFVLHNSSQKWCVKSKVTRFWV